MIIAPLVFSTLVVGIAHMEDAAAIGRVGAKTIAWFILASLVSLTLGLVMVHLFQPGVGLALPAGARGRRAGRGRHAHPDGLHHPSRAALHRRGHGRTTRSCRSSSSPASSAPPSRRPRTARPPILALVEQIATIMLKVTGYVMLLAPLVVFAALASTVATQGVGILLTYAKFVGGFYFAMLTAVGAAARRRRGHPARRILPLLRAIREPVLLAFSTASSEAAYPKLLENLQTIGLPRQHRQLRPAARLFVQSRRLDDVLHLRDAVHRPGL